LNKTLLLNNKARRTLGQALSFYLAFRYPGQVARLAGRGLSPAVKEKLFFLIDTILRDTKAQKAYAH
jgi:hypothetical protein